MRRELIRGVGRHSRKGPAPEEAAAGAAPVDADGTGRGTVPGPGSGRRRRAAGAPAGADGHGPSWQAGHVRGGHPEQREPGGGWGTGTRQAVARPREQAAARAPIPGPRREFVEAFDAPPTAPAPPVAPAPRRPSAPPADPYSSVGGWDAEPPSGGGASQAPARGTRGRTLTGVAAAAVTTVLAVVVAGQVHDSGGTNAAQSAGVDRDTADGASRSDDRPSSKVAQTAPLSYAQKMAKAYPLAPDLAGPGTFDAVAGSAKAPGKGRTYRYRVDVEKGLGLDASLFAQAVQETLNDGRSWAHNGAMTFERISSGDPDFVITLASPGTTAEWCRKSGLDTTQDNVSCDSAATERVMINAYRWAQGSSTFGPDLLFAYRRMLINHEVGHRLGHNHVSCRTAGALAPVMQQQTKSLNIDGIKCRPNAWVYPAS
ncbi:DUF3152 domain-containing protein [Streptomyces sp. NPDC052052]|uniref:DUF3152 domain-containing protein n=1 Tax=Streptomyces sp. NPDC052052 TaxID=3154756 RepID=UPI00341AE2D5